jgi:hypothetical protein
MGKTKRITVTSIVAVALLCTFARGEEAPAPRELGATTASPIDLTARLHTVRIPLREDARALIDAAMVRSSKTALSTWRSWLESIFSLSKC